MSSILDFCAETEHFAQGAGSEQRNGTHGTHGTESTGMSAGTGPVTENGAQGRPAGRHGHFAQGAGCERGNGTHGTHGTHGTGGIAADGTGMSAGTGPVTDTAQGAEEGAARPAQGADNDFGMRAGEASADDLKLAGTWLLEHYGGGIWPDDFFPKTGVAVYDEAGPVTVIPVYLEQSGSVAVCGHFCARPGLPPRQLHAAARMALACCQTYARNQGRKYLLSLWGRRSVSRMAEKLGMQNVDVAQEQILFLDRHFAQGTESERGNGTAGGLS